MFFSRELMYFFTLYFMWAQGAFSYATAIDAEFPPNLDNDLLSDFQEDHPMLRSESRSRSLSLKLIEMAEEIDDVRKSLDNKGWPNPSMRKDVFDCLQAAAQLTDRSLFSCADEHAEAAEVCVTNLHTTASMVGVIPNGPPYFGADISFNFSQMSGVFSHIATNLACLIPLLKKPHNRFQYPYQQPKTIAFKPALPLKPRL